MPINSTHHAKLYPQNDERGFRDVISPYAIELEVCMGMGKTGIPSVPWDSHGNGCKISRGMGMGWEWEFSAWEWELRRGSCHLQL